MFRASLCPSSGDQRPCYCIWCTALVLLDVVGSSTPYAVTHGLCSPEDGHNDARNTLRQKLIINIWLLHFVGFLSLHISWPFRKSNTDYSILHLLSGMLVQSAVYVNDFFLTFIGPCIANIFSDYNQQDATFHDLFISVRRSTCFRRVFRPSSGEIICDQEHKTAHTASGTCQTDTATCR